MSTSFDQVRTMKEDNYGNTEPPSIGGSVDYFYIGAYEGGDDVLGGILDKLLGGMEYLEHAGGHDGVFMSVEGGNNQGYNGNKILKNEDELVNTLGLCAYDDCPVDIRDDEDESLVVVSEPPVNTDVREFEYTHDPSEYNSLTAVKKGEPLIIETTTRKPLNEDFDKLISRSVSDALFDDTEDNIPLVVKTSEKEGNREFHGGGNNIKMEDYKVVSNYIKKYMETINKKSFKEIM